MSNQRTPKEQERETECSTPAPLRTSSIVCSSANPWMPTVVMKETSNLLSGEFSCPNVTTEVTTTMAMNVSSFKNFVVKYMKYRKDTSEAIHMDRYKLTTIIIVVVFIIIILLLKYENLMQAVRNVRHRPRVNQHRSAELNAYCQLSRCCASCSSTTVGWRMWEGTSSRRTVRSAIDRTWRKRNARKVVLVEF